MLINVTLRIPHLRKKSVLGITFPLLLHTLKNEGEPNGDGKKPRHIQNWIDTVCIQSGKEENSLVFNVPMLRLL